jgi:anti-anti-sigma factor
MKSSTRQVDGVTIVDLSGRITLGEGSVVLRETVRDLLSKGQKKILLNLGDVNYIDSSGIGELVSAFTTCQEPGWRTQAAQPHQESARPAADHEALHRLRCQGRRSSGP